MVFYRYLKIDTYKLIKFDTNFERRVDTIRIIIDTTNNVIICPKTFWEDIRKANEVIRSLEKEGIKEIDHKAKVKEYFDSAIKNDLVRASDVKKR